VHEGGSGGWIKKKPKHGLGEAKKKTIREAKIGLVTGARPKLGILERRFGRTG